MWGYAAWGLVLVVVICMLVQLRTMFSIYVCTKCQKEYKLSKAKEFLFPQIMYRKISRCPHCKKIVAAYIIRNEENAAGARQGHSAPRSAAKAKNKKR